MSRFNAKSRVFHWDNYSFLHVWPPGPDNVSSMTVSFRLELQCEKESADKTFPFKAFLWEDFSLGRLAHALVGAYEGQPLPDAAKTLHHQSLYWPEGPEDGTLSITGSLVVRGVIILTVDSNKMLMRLFSFLPSCLHSPYNTVREPRDSAANIACHYDMAISIIRKHQAVAPG